MACKGLAENRPASESDSTMTDTRPTNEQIADLLKQQTYEERFEMAVAFRDLLSDQKADMDASEGFSPADIAGIFEIWANSELEPTP